jgi:hypothetical protein
VVVSELDQISFWKRCCLLLALVALAAVIAANDATDLAEKYEASAARHARIVAGCLNGWVISTPEVKVACKRVKS